MSGRSKFNSSDRAWVGAQTVLLGIAFAGGVIEVLVAGRGFDLGRTAVSVTVGGVLVVVAIAVVSRAVRDLAENLTPAPTPVEDCVLVDRGIYGVVRHPIYLGMLLVLLGWAILFGSWLSLAVAVLVVPFFVAKARHEERLLRERVPGYPEYMTRVRGRFIPRVL